MLIIFWEKGAWNLTKNISNLSIPSKFFIVIKYSTTAMQISCQQNSKKFLDMIIYTDRFSTVLSKSSAWQSNYVAFSVFDQKIIFIF